jgi:hypothetical protein
MAQKTAPALNRALGINIMNNNYDPNLVKEAKKMAAGPLGKEMAKFPMRFAAPIFFGENPSINNKPKIKNGTASFIDFGNGPFAITCYHVLSPFMDQMKNGNEIIFQIGNLKFNPLEQIISEDEKLDLISISLTKEQRNEISLDREIGALSFNPPFWPPKEVKEGDYVAFGGFPGKWRQHLSKHEMLFDTYSSGGCGVASVRDEYLICQFEREYWINSFDFFHEEELYDIGGLSGGPVFLKRPLYWELVGIIYEF